MVSQIYTNCQIYYNLIKQYLNRSVTVLEFKRNYFNNHTSEIEYPSGNVADLTAKLSDERMFQEDNYHMLKELEEQINALEFTKEYWRQRDVDLEENSRSGYSDNYRDKIRNLIGNEKVFKQEYSAQLYEKSRSPHCLDILKQYEEAARRLDIKGELFFMGLWYFIDEYVRDYTPSDASYFNPEMDVDEKTLRNVIQHVYEVLERNKERWLNGAPSIKL